jgi:hypothetical protein
LAKLKEPGYAAVICRMATGRATNEKRPEIIRSLVR